MPILMFTIYRLLNSSLKTYFHIILKMVLKNSDLLILKSLFAVLHSEFKSANKLSYL